MFPNTHTRTTVCKAYLVPGINLVIMLRAVIIQLCIQLCPYNYSEVIIQSIFIGHKWYECQ